MGRFGHRLFIGRVADELARAIGLAAGDSSKAERTAILWKLLDGKPESIEEQNQEVSEALESDFSNPGYHEQAAVLLGAFLLREHSGHFLKFARRFRGSRLTLRWPAFCAAQTPSA